MRTLSNAHRKRLGGMIKQGGTILQYSICAKLEPGLTHYTFIHNMQFEKLIQIHKENKNTE